MLLGICLILLSFTPWLIDIPASFKPGMIFALIWGVGYLILCNSIISKFSARKKSERIFFSHKQILIAGAIAGIVIEVFGNWIWKLWYYPSFSILAYLSLMIIIQIVYFYFILKGYLAIRAIFIAAGAGKKRVRRNGVKNYRKIYISFGLVGAFGLAVGIVQAVGLLNYVDSSFFNSYQLKPFNLINILLISLSLWCVLEYLEFKEKEDSFIMHIAQGDWTPLASIVIASVLTSLSMEGFNIPLSIWVYTNWPLPEFNFIGMPIAVFLAWPIQYILLISMFRVLYKKQTARIWY